MAIYTSNDVVASVDLVGHSADSVAVSFVDYIFSSSDAVIEPVVDIIPHAIVEGQVVLGRVVLLHQLFLVLFH